MQCSVNTQDEIVEPLVERAHLRGICMLNTICLQNHIFRPKMQNLNLHTKHLLMPHTDVCKRRIYKPFWCRISGQGLEVRGGHTTSCHVPICPFHHHPYVVSGHSPYTSVTDLHDWRAIVWTVKVIDIVSDN